MKQVRNDGSTNICIFVQRFVICRLINKFFMPRKTNYEHQKSILSAVLAVILCVSFILILFERNRIKEALSVPKNEKIISDMAVQGARVSKDEQIVQYRVKAISFARALNDYIEFAENTEEELPKAELEDIKNSILSEKTPELYKDLHFKLVQVASFLQGGGKLNYAVEQMRLVFEQFPWLTSST